MTSIRAATLAAVAAAVLVLAVLVVVGRGSGDHLATKETRASAVAETLGGLDASDFVRLRVGDSPADRTTSAPSWVYGELKPTVDSYESTWEADLAVGAIALRLHTRPTATTSSVIGGATFTFAPTSGSGSGHVRAPVEIGPAPVDQAFSSPTDAPDASIESDAEAAVRADGLSPTTVRVLRPYGPAVYVDLTVDPHHPPTGPIDLLSLENAVAGPFGAQTMEGVMVEVHDPGGHLLAVAYTASRTWTGGAWTYPRYTTLFPFNHG